MHVSVADPDSVVAVEVDGGPVLSVLIARLTRTRRPVSGTGNGLVHGQEEVSTGARGKQVIELDANRLWIPGISR